MPGKRGSRGGKRQGAPGQSYPNRKDLTQAPRAVPNQTYGQAGAQIAAQQAVPIAGPGMTMPQPVPLNAPTARPGEPVTSGAPLGVGPGTEALVTPGGMNPDDDAEALLRAIYKQHPTSDIARLLSEIDIKRTM